MQTDVLIIGAGPTGLMCAALLKRSGINCRIIDKNPYQVKESRALAIQARSMELFQKLGLVEKFLARGMIAKGAKAYLNGEEKLSVDFSDMARKDTPYPYVFFLSQAETEKILCEDIESLGIKVERNTALLDIHQNVKGVEAIVQLPDGKKTIIQARYLIGSDGSHSAVRQSLNLDFEGGSYPSQFIMSDAKVDWEFDHKHLRVFLNPGSIGIFFPLQDEALSRVLTIREVDKEFQPRTKTTTSFPASLHEIEENFNEATHCDVRLSNPVWVTKFHVHHRCVEKMQVRRVFLAGDAAHIHSPAGGQGMNTGIQDAANLCWKIAWVLKGHAHPEMLETYHQERWPVAQKLLKFTDRFFSIATSPNRALVKIRDLLLPVVTTYMMKKPAGRRAIFGFISQLEIHYHPNLTVINKAGNRLPDFELKSGRRIFDILKGYQFHLLVFDDQRVEEVFQDVKIHYVKSDFKDKGMILVRPDGYTAVESDDHSEMTMRDIRRILTTPEEEIRTQGLALSSDKKIVGN